MKIQTAILCSLVLLSSAALATEHISEGYSQNDPPISDAYCVLYTSSGKYLSHADGTLSGSNTCTEDELWVVRINHMSPSYYTLVTRETKYLKFDDDGFQITYHVGSRNEATGHTGATHLLEHLMFKGSKNFKLVKRSKC